MDPEQISREAALGATLVAVAAVALVLLAIASSAPIGETLGRVQANLTSQNVTTGGNHTHEPLDLPGPLPTIPGWCAGHLCGVFVIGGPFYLLLAGSAFLHAKWGREG